MPSAEHRELASKLAQLIGAEAEKTRRRNGRRPSSGAQPVEVEVSATAEQGGAKRKPGRPKNAPGQAGEPRQTRSQVRRRLEKEIDGPLMSVEEAAAYMRVSSQTVYDEANAETLPTFRRGKRILIVKPLLDLMIRAEALKRWKIDPKTLEMCPNCGRKGEFAAESQSSGV